MLELFVYFCQLVAVLAFLIVVPSLIGLAWAAKSDRRKQKRLDQFWREKR